jgi:hypothetical protein
MIENMNHGLPTLRLFGTEVCYYLYISIPTVTSRYFCLLTNYYLTGLLENIDDNIFHHTSALIPEMEREKER